MNEAGYKSSVHRKLPLSVYRQGVAMKLAIGIPDVYYSGPTGDLWVEYKYLTKTPKRSFKPKLTDHQRLWLIRRAEEGRNVAVIVGCPDGCFILTGTDCDKRCDPADMKEKRYAVEFIQAATAADH